MAIESFRVEGLQGVLDTLKQLPPELVSKNGGPVRTALRKASVLIQKQAQANVQSIMDTPNAGGMPAESTGLLLKNIITQRIKPPRGRVLGGSSSINGLLYVRGQREDFDGWAARGNPGWAYEDVLTFFRRSEDQVRGADHWHATGGELGVADLDAPHPIAEAFIAAGAHQGIARNDDFNGERQEGVGYFQATARGGGLHCITAAHDHAIVLQQ